jgi:hypothetical protein
VQSPRRNGMSRVARWVSSFDFWHDKGEPFP